MNLAYTRFEFVRLFRNRQNVAFSLVFPLVIFFAVASANVDKNVNGDGRPVITFGRFYFAGMVTFGMLAAVVSGGARIAAERQIGWNRQLRLTPLTPRTYLRTKILTSYVLAIISLGVLSLAALALGTDLPLHDWLKGAGLSLVALIPFAALGVLLGHLIKGESMGPVIGGALSLFAALGGAYFPIGQGSGFLHELVRVIPSFWLTQANKSGIGGQAWTTEAWIVIAAWAVVLGTGAIWAYRRDTERQA